MKRPAFQFYPADWRKDVDLQSCSIAARGLWHELLCVMHECKPYGHLVLQSGTSPTDAQAARLVGMELREYRTALAELETVNVFSRLADRTIYSRRMVKDETIRNIRAEAGSKGGNPVLLGAKVNQNHNQKDDGHSAKVNQRDNLGITPSSSSSSSSSKDGVDGDINARATGRKPKPGLAPSKGKNGAEVARWWLTEAGTIAEGKRRGVEARPGEDGQAFRDRVRQARSP